MFSKCLGCPHNELVFELGLSWWDTKYQRCWGNGGKTKRQFVDQCCYFSFPMIHEPVLQVLQWCFWYMVWEKADRETTVNVGFCFWAVVCFNSHSAHRISQKAQCTESTIRLTGSSELMAFWEMLAPCLGWTWNNFLGFFMGLSPGVPLPRIAWRNANRLFPTAEWSPKL